MLSKSHPWKLISKSNITDFSIFHLHLPFCCPDLRVSRPLIVPGYPENTTGVVGGQVKLVCKVHRPVSTKVQWLKTEASAPGRSQGGPPRLRALTVRTDQLTDTNNFTVHVLFKLFFWFCPQHIKKMLKWSLLHAGPAEQRVQGEHFASVQHHTGGCRRVYLHGREHPCRTDSTGHAFGMAGRPAWWDKLIITPTFGHISQVCLPFRCNLSDSFIQRSLWAQWPPQ